MPAHQVLRLRLSQIGTAAEGVLELGGVEVDVSGAIGPNGMLTLTGGRTDDTHTVTITGWRSTTDGPVMTGNFGYTIAPGDEALGTVVVTAVLENVRKDALGVAGRR